MRITRIHFVLPVFIYISSLCIFIIPNTVYALAYGSAIDHINDNKTKPWLVVRCRFQDTSETGPTTESLETAFSMDYPHIGHYWKTTTYGHVDITGTNVLPQWYTMPHNRDYYMRLSNDQWHHPIDRDMMIEDCRDATGVTNLSQYYGVYAIFSGGGFPCCTAFGDVRMSDGMPGVVDSGFDVSLAIHEIGHAYWLPHSMTDPASYPYYGSERKGWDVMAKGWMQSPAVHTLAPFKYWLGAIPQQYIKTVDIESGDVDVTINLHRQEELPVNSDEYTLAIINFSDGSRYYVEARDKSMQYEGNIPSTNIIVNRAIFDNPFTSSTSAALLVKNNYDTWSAGRGVGERIDLSENVHVNILANNGDGFTIQVFNALRGDLNSDMEISNEDAVIVMRKSLGFPISGTGYTDARADVNCSGSVTISDALLILRKSINLITRSWCTQ